MIDREKVIKGLEETKIILTQAVDRGGEMSVIWAFHCLNHVTDALELLKEQEPAKPREERHEVKVSHYWGDEVEVLSKFYCPHCGTMIAKGKSEHYPRCMWCGQEVKWE